MVRRKTIIVEKTPAFGKVMKKCLNPLCGKMMYFYQNTWKNNCCSNECVQERKNYNHMILVIEKENKKYDRTKRDKVT